MHPVLIQFTDSFYLGTYGVMIAIGLLACVWVGGRRGRTRGITGDNVIDLALLTIFCGFLGARLTYIGQHFGEFLENPKPFILSRTGFVFLGGLAGGTLAAIAYIRIKHLRLWSVADIAAVSVPLAHAFGRIGCHFAGCCYGGVCTVPALAIRVPLFRDGAGEPIGNAFVDQVIAGKIPPDAALSLPIWPVQLFESLALFLLAGGIALWAARKPRPEGLSFGVYLIGYGLLRFTLEFLRGDEVRGLYFGGLLSFSQIVSLLAIAGGFYVCGVRWNAAPHVVEPATNMEGSETDSKNHAPRRRTPPAAPSTR